MMNEMETLRRSGKEVIHKLNVANILMSYLKKIQLSTKKYLGIYTNWIFNKTYQIHLYSSVFINTEYLRSKRNYRKTIRKEKKKTMKKKL